MKFLKKLTTFCMAIALCFGAGMAMASCGDNPEDSSSQTQNTATYNFYVVKQDQTPAIGYKIQLCEPGATCLPPVAVSENGTLSYTVLDKGVDYEVHIMKGNATIENAHTTTTVALTNNGGNIPANYQGGTITIIVTK